MDTTIEVTYRVGQEARTVEVLSLDSTLVDTLQRLYEHRDRPDPRMMTFMLPQGGGIAIDPREIVSISWEVAD